MSDLEPGCSAADHNDERRPQGSAFSPDAYERAAGIFSAMGDPNRLRILTLLMSGERCVSELSAALEDNLPAVSQRLKLLRSERIVKTRREGKHVYYDLADQHIAGLVSNVLAHAAER